MIREEFQAAGIDFASRNVTVSMTPELRAGAAAAGEPGGAGDPISQAGAAAALAVIQREEEERAKALAEAKTEREIARIIDGFVTSGERELNNENRRKNHRTDPTRRSPRAKNSLEEMGTLPQRTPVGHRARGLQRERRRLGLFHPRPRPLARLPLGRGRPGRHFRRQAAPLLRAGAVERQGSRSSRNACSA